MAAPLRVGILDDMAAGPPGFAGTEWLRFAADELIAKGRLDREVEFVTAWGLGLPLGTEAAVERAFRSLLEQDVLLIAGPAIGNNSPIATVLAEQYRMPTLNWAGTERARSEFMFQLQVGSHEDESILLARHLAAYGAARIGVVFDRSPIGRRHLSFFQTEAEILGLRIAAMTAIPPAASSAAGIADELINADVDAILYMGLGLAVPALAQALEARGWRGERCMNTAGIRGYDPAFAALIDGWTYVDMHADNNRTLADLRQRTNTPPAGAFAAAKGYDLGRLVAEGLSRAPEFTREGVRDGLEQIKWLPAAQGEDGTLLGFGVYERAALHGRYLVLRRWIAGASVQRAGTA